MASEEIGSAELKRLVRRHWKSILALAGVLGLLTTATLLFSPDSYLATARVVVFPVMGEAEENEERNLTEVYSSLLRSDALIAKTTGALKSTGVLKEGEKLAYGRNLFYEVKAGGSLLELTGRAQSAERAATIANAWAEIFVEESQSMPRSRVSAYEAVLDRELAPTRQQLEEMEDEHVRLVDDFEKRETELSTQWDRRILAAKKKAERAVADFQTETRRLMDGSIAEQFPETGGEEQLAAAIGADIATELRRLISVRAELAQTPRVLDLEKSASEDAISEALIEGQDPDSFDSTLISQEMNPLFDQLSIRALDFEIELKRLAGRNLADISRVLEEIERIQRERAAGLASLMEQNRLDQRLLRRQQSSALKDLQRERASVLTKHERRIEPLDRLESTISTRLSSLTVSGLFERVEIVSLAAPASNPVIGEPRKIPTKIATATFLGGLLGLVIALFRSAES